MINRSLFLSVATVALLSAGAAHAGNSSFTQQDGDNQVLNADQSGSGNQIGANGQPFVQNNGSGTGGNNLQITQSGNGNGFGVDKQAFQSGTQDAAVVTQQGRNSEVDLQQSGSFNGNAGSGGGLPWNNTSNGYANDITQDGTAKRDLIDLEQSGTNAVFSIGQGGSDNRATIRQDGAGESFSFIRQDDNTGHSSIDLNQAPDAGNYNYVALVQDSGLRDAMNVVQTGSYTSANFTQEGGNDNLVVSNQSGTSNFAGLTAQPAPYGTDQSFVQNGSGNQAFNYQSGTNNSLLGGQTGRSNTVSNNQSNSMNSLVTSQNGDRNSLYSIQSSSNSAVTSSQSGNGNFAQSNQFGGMLLTANLTQSGNNNQIFGSQQGMSNIATISQTTSGNVSSYSQSGSNNSMTVTQH